MPLTLEVPYGNPRITFLPRMLSVLSWQPALRRTGIYAKMRIAEKNELPCHRQTSTISSYLIRKILQLNRHVRHTGRESEARVRRYPEHREVNLDCPPWLLDSGNPCRNDEYG